MREVKKLAGLFVGIDKLVLFDIEHNDRFRRVLNQRAITLLVFPERLLRFFAIAHVTQVDHEDLIVTGFQAACINLGGKGTSAFACCADFAAGKPGV